MNLFFRKREILLILFIWCLLLLVLTSFPLRRMVIRKMQQRVMRESACQNGVCRPNLYVIGFPKSGSSTLHYLLALFPQICMSKLKEPNFLLAASNFTETPDKITTYLTFWQHCNSSSLYWGESSVGYIRSLNAVANILQLNGKAKFLVVVRDPIDTLYSWYWMNKFITRRDEGKEYGSFENLVNADFRKLITHGCLDEDLKRKQWSYSCLSYCPFLRMGIQGDYLKMWHSTFPSERFLYIPSRALQHKQSEVRQCIGRFLGIDPPLYSGVIKYNEACSWGWKNDGSEKSKLHNEVCLEREATEKQNSTILSNLQIFYRQDPIVELKIVCN